MTAEIAEYLRVYARLRASWRVLSELEDIEDLVDLMTTAELENLNLK